MPIVKANENPILLEEVLDEGLIDAIRQGANYLRDRRTVRDFNRIAKNIQNSNTDLSEDQRNKLKLKSYYAQKAQDRNKMFKNYIKDRFSKSGRSFNKMRKEMQTKLTDEEKQIMKLQDRISEKHNKPGYNEDSDPDIKKLQQLTSNLSQKNPTQFKDSMNNIKNYRKDQNKISAFRTSDGSVNFNPYDQRVVNKRNDYENNRSDNDRINDMNKMLQRAEDRKKAEEDRIEKAKATINRINNEEAKKQQQNNQRQSQIKPLPNNNNPVTAPAK